MTGQVDLLTPEEAAALLRVTPATVGYWRKQKRGPAYVKIGRRVRYPRAALFAALEVVRPAQGAAVGVVS